MTLKDLFVSKQFYAVLAIACFAIVLFPGNYFPLDVGLDPSWRYAINYLPHSAEVFGRDVTFTYGPLGYFLEPLNVGSNLVQATLFHAFMHGLLIVILLDYALRRKKYFPAIFLVVSFVLAPLVGQGLSSHYEYSYLIVSCVLLVIAYENEKLSIVAEIINPIFAGLFLFMKFSLGLSVILMIAALTVVKIFRRQQHAWRSALIIAGGWLVTTLVIGIRYCGSLRTLGDWLVTSWQMADGYSAAMSTSGPPHTLAWALVAVSVYLAFLIFLWSSGSPGFQVALVFVIPLFFCFKHSFVRQDVYHILNFFPFLLSVVGVLGLNARNGRELRFVAYCFVIILVLSLPNARLNNYLNYSVAVDRLSGGTGLSNLTALLNLNDMRRRLDAQGQANLESVRLPAEWTNLIGEQNGEVGTIPWEVSYCPANSLRWDPFPALQTYGAYKATLDQWAAEHYSNGHGPEFLLITFDAIDQRHPLLNAPATWRAILANYALLKTEAVNGVQLFKKTEKSALSDLTTIRQEPAGLSEWVSVPQSDKLLYAFPQMRLRPLGWASKTFYQIPAVVVTVMYASGRYAAFRINPDTARNGLLMNYLPTDTESLDRVFANFATDRVTRFRISGPGASYYNQEFELTWKERPAAAIEFAPGERLNIQTLLPLTEAPLYAIDYFNRRPVDASSGLVVDGASEDEITIFGWAVDPKSRTAAGGVFVNIDGMDIEATYNRVRRDVAEFQHNANYAASGFMATFPSSIVAKGVHNLSLKIVTSGKDGYYQTQPITLEVK